MLTHNIALQGRAEQSTGGGGGRGCSAQRSHAGLRPPPLHVQPADTSHPGQDWPLSTHPSRFVLPTYTHGPFPLITKPAPPHGPGFSGLKSDGRTSTSPLPPSQVAHRSWQPQHGVAFLPVKWRTVTFPPKGSASRPPFSLSEPLAPLLLGRGVVI